MAITAGQTFSGTVGVLFSQTPAYTGTVTGWSATGLPTGLSINSTTGVISGTPTTSGNVTASVSGSGAIVSKIAAGTNHSLALKNDGTVIGWGSNQLGQTTIPTGLSGVTAISAGDGYSMALKSDGTVLEFGSVAGDNQNEVPMPSGLSGVAAISAGFKHSVALKNDGSLVAWGWKKINPLSAIDQSNALEIPSGLSEVLAISAGYSHTLALKSDGTVVGWGLNSSGQTTIPTGLSGVTAISAGGGHSLALKSDGTVVAWGSNEYGQATIPAGLSGVTAISAGRFNSLALKSDGTVVGWGLNSSGQTTIPAGLSGVTAISAGGGHSLALKSDGTVAGWGLNSNGQTSAPNFTTSANISFNISSSGSGGGGSTMSILLAENQTLIATLGAPFSQTPALLLGTAAAWYATGLPEWASINSATGAITGTPTFSGNSVVTVTAKASDNATSTALVFLNTTAWNTLEIFVDPKARRVLSKADTKSPLSKITLKRDDRLPFRVIFVDGTTPFSIPDSFSVSVGLKKSYSDTDYLAYSSSATGTLDLSSEEIQVLFLANAAVITALLEVRWESPTSSFRTVTLPADLQNSVIRGNEYSPAAYFGADATTSAATTSAAVRAISTPVFGIAKGNSYNITILPTDRRVSIAYPASLGDLASVRYAEFNNSDITDTFTKTTVQVSAPGASTIPYFVYTYIAGVPFDDYANYTVTL